METFFFGAFCGKRNATQMKTTMMMIMMDGEDDDDDDDDGDCR